MNQNFDFHHEMHTMAGRYTQENIREMMSSQFGHMGLTLEAKNHFARSLGSGKLITGKDFHEAVKDAHEKGLITEQRAEQIRDEARLPEGYD
jgi:hypothetical protein